MSDSEDSNFSEEEDSERSSEAEEAEVSAKGSGETCAWGPGTAAPVGGQGSPRPGMSSLSGERSVQEEQTGPGSGRGAPRTLGCSGLRIMCSDTVGFFFVTYLVGFVLLLLFAVLGLNSGP